MVVTAEAEIRRRIRADGRINFAEFMELALYWPHKGYYSSKSPVGVEGDYYTSPGAHPAFGALLAVQLYQMWRLLGRPRPFWVLEAGAGIGLLCHDVLNYSQYLPEDFQHCLRYSCIDVRLGRGVEDQLPYNLRSSVDRVAGYFPFTNLEGCILSNELIDAFPVHRIVMRNGELKEVYITLESGKYEEVLGEPSTEALEERFMRLGIRLPEGYTTEVNLAMETWLEKTALALRRGYVLTIDYGREAAELYSEARARGTLACYYRHIQTDNPYVHVGEQDISAQVDFSTLKQVGQDYGLNAVGEVSQETFLSNLCIRKMMSRLGAKGLGQQQRDANRMGMLDLIRPGGLGGFRVLAQEKDASGYPLWGFKKGKDMEELLARLPVPLLTALHMPLLQGSYPYLAMDW